MKSAVSIIECCMVSSDAFFTSSADTLNFRATNWASSISSSENLLNLLIMKSMDGVHLFPESYLYKYW